MTIFQSASPLSWPLHKMPMQGIERDWHDQPTRSKIHFALAEDSQYLWLITRVNQPAQLHPCAIPGAFQEGLWEHDVAELFIADTQGSGYLEFNLAPNGAWWCCEFTDTRVRASTTPTIIKDIHTYSQILDSDGWQAAMAIPLEYLKNRIHWSLASRINVTLILNFPEPQFFSVTQFGGGTPDFHQPSKFDAFEYANLDGPAPNSPPS